MTFSKHAIIRMNERTIDYRLANLVAKYGKKLAGCRDRYILNRDNIPDAELVDKSPAFLAHVEHQLPIVAAICEGVVTTVFKPNERIRRKRGKNHNTFSKAIASIIAIKEAA